MFSGERSCTVDLQSELHSALKRATQLFDLLRPRWTFSRHTHTHTLGSLMHCTHVHMHSCASSFLRCQSESEESPLLRDLCFRFCFFLVDFFCFFSFLFLSFLFFCLFLPRRWCLEDEDEEEEEESESEEEVVSASSCWSCWIL